MEKIWYLKQIDIFKGLGPEEMDFVDRISVMREVPKKSPIFLPGDRGDRVYLLKKGAVKLARLTESGKEVILAVLKTGEIFGETAVVEEGTRSTLAEALEDTYICEIRRSDFEALLQRRPDLALRLTKIMGLRRRVLEERIEDLVYQDVPTRMAKVLLRLAREYGRDVVGGRRINLRLTHADLAGLAGCTRETASACLSDFKRRGLIRYEHKIITILDSHGLEKLAG